MNKLSTKKSFNFGHIVILTLITSLCYLPFIDKAVHIDDPLFIWVAKHIQSQTTNPYNFDVNWYGKSMPMYEITKNPPIASYYMAGVASFGEWNERMLHLFFLIPFIGVVIGTYFIALQFCSHPLDSTLISLLTPVVLLSATTLMCDILMLCFWVWATFTWIKGIKSNNKLLLSISGILILLSALTKYFGMNLILLLLVWTIFEKRKLSSSILFLLIPIAGLAGYHWATYVLYGKGLLLDAASYSSQLNTLTTEKYLSKLLIGLAFSGGSFAIVFFYLHRTWNKYFLIVNVIFLIAIGYFLIGQRIIGKVNFVAADNIQWSYLVQFSLAVLVGINLILLTVVDIARKRDADSLLLFLWTIGTFLFAILINWTINGRTLLPLAPVVGILIVRQMESKSGAFTSGWKNYLSLIPAALLTLAVTYSDYILANTIRNDATKIVEKYRSSNSTIWFQGHWGFQYYMEANGCKPLDTSEPNISAGDIIVSPLNNTNLFRLPSYLPLRDSIESKTLSWLSCMNHKARAGFYSDVWGPLPFVWGNIQPERYDINISQRDVRSK